MKTWWGQPWVRWPHVSDPMRYVPERHVMIGGDHYTIAEANEIATAIMRLLMEDAAAKVKR